MSTLPSAYLVSSRWTARSTASEIAMPSEPELSGLSFRMALPDSVRFDGLAWHVAPKLSMNALR